MQTPTPHRCRARVGFRLPPVSILLWLASFAWAQQAPAPPPTASSKPDETPIELAPFTVQENTDTGYAASTTLAGSRLRTDLRDVSSQVTVFTKDFLEDVAAFTVEQAYTYSSNVVPAHEQPETAQAIVGTFFLRYGGGSQIRGMGSPTQSRSFFATVLEADNYNTERISIASGPNAILFGLGSPAGITDTTSKIADLRRNRGEIVFRADDFGSTRVELDVSRMVKRDVLALRVAAVRDRSKEFLEPNFDHQDRYYGAVTYRPHKKITLRAQGEIMRRDAARSPYTLPFDGFTPWVANGSPAWSRSTPAGNFRYLVANTTNRFLVINGATAAPVAPANWNGTVDLKPLGTYMVDARPGDALYDPTFRPEDNGPVTIRDDRLYPVRSYNIFGNTRVNRIRGDFISGFAEFQLAPNLFFEAAYNHERRLERAASNFAANQNVILYDANQLLPTTLGTNAANPNLGRAYVQGTPAGFQFDQREEELRGTLSYELELQKRHFLLGRHRLAGLASHRLSKDITQSMARRIFRNTDGTTPSFLTLPAVQGDQPNYMTAGNAARVIQMRTYLDLQGAGPKYAERYQALSPLDDWQIPDPGNPSKTMLIGFFNEEMGAVNAANAFRQSINSRMVAYNGYFFREHLVLTYGIRRDDAENARFADASTRIFNGLFPHYKTLSWGPNDPKQELENDVKGAMLHVPLPARLKPLSLSVFYNVATNNSLSSRALGVTGRQNPGQQGDGKNYGVRLSLFQDKLVLRADWFDNSANGAEIGGVAPLVGPMALLENRMEDIDPNYKAGTFDPVALGTSVYRPTLNQRNRGREVELVGNPRPGLTLRAVAGQGRPQTSSAGAEWVAYAKAREEVWKNIEWWDRSDPANPLPVVSWNRTAGTFVVGQRGQAPLKGWENVGYASGPNQPATQTVQQQWQTSVVRDSYSLENQIGRRAAQHREWRFNATAAYTFQEGKLAGLRTGMSTRYRGKALIGYVSDYVTFGTERVLAANLDRPIFAPDEWFFDTFVAYRGRMKWRNLRYRVQLNIQNVLDEDDIYPTYVDSRGNPARFAQFAGRRSLLSTSVEF